MVGPANTSAIGRDMGLIDPVEMAISAFTAMRDTILGARTAKKEERRAWFANHVEPLDKLMRSIYDDYSAGFRELTKKLREEKDPNRAIELLKDLRLKRVRSRKEVIAIAQELAHAKKRRLLGRGLGEDFYALFLAVDQFSTAAQPEQGLTYFSSFISSFEDILRRGGNPYNRDLYPISANDAIAAVITRIDYCRQTLMPEAWATYTAAYQRVRLQSV